MRTTIDSGDAKGAPGRKRPALLRKLLYSLLPLLLLLAVAEVAARLIPRPETEPPPVQLVMEDPQLGWRLYPRDRGPLATNELGLRDGPYNDAADVKVLLLGDSVAWGDRVLDVGKVFPQLLERSLNQLDAPTSYEVINASAPGYSTFQQADYLRLHGLAFMPRLVVLAFCLNDVVERYHAMAEYGGKSSFLGVDTRTGTAGWYGALLRNSRAFESVARAIQRRARSREAYTVQGLTVDRMDPTLEKAWNRTLQEIELIHRTAGEQGIPLLLVIEPYRHQLEDPERMRQPQDRLIEFAEIRGFAVVDLLPEFVRSGEGAALFEDANHFSVLGHRVTADALVAPVRQALSRDQDAG